MNIAEKVLLLKKDFDDVYEAGKAAAGGGDSYYDTFWDEFQQNGKRTNYTYGFCGMGWNDETFKPKYDVCPVTDGYMFSHIAVTDMIKALEKAGVKLDLSKSNSDIYLLYSTNVTRFPTIDTTSRANINYFIYLNPNLEYIEKIILKSDGSQRFNDYSFYQNPLLTEVRFEGTIGYSIRFVGSPLLSNASIQSIIDCLKDLSGSTAQTLTVDATVGAKLTDEQKATITAKNWTLVY